MFLIISLTGSNTEHEKSLVRKNHVKNFWKAHPARKSWLPAFTDLGVTLYNMAAMGEGRTECGVEEGQGEDGMGTSCQGREWVD